jgi:16S rRNA (cytidine1402-2'-O)-methyltransferase
VLVSTPIGNLGDIGQRACAALAAADVVLCEDTRHTARLLSALGISARLRSLHDHNESERVPHVLDLLQSGRRVALVSDAGTPVISDPGFRLVRAAIAAGLPVTAIPGPNAAVVALTLSGLPPQPFLFVGFLPPRGGARRGVLHRLRAGEQVGLSATTIFHEAPHRLGETLADMAAILGDRPAAVAREMTKRFEEIRRGGLDALARNYARDEPRGELTIVVGPAEARPSIATVDLDDRLRAVLSTHSIKDAATIVAGETGMSRRSVYARALELASGDERAQE